MTPSVEAPSSSVRPAPADLPWHIVTRWQEFRGESRANVLRIVSVGLFYLVWFAAVRGVNFLGLELPQTPQTIAMDRAITWICLAWVGLGLGVLLLLRNHIFPCWLKYVTTGCDLLLIALVLMAGSGARSPMVAGYFVILAMSGLRFSLPLVRVSTVGAAFSFLAVNAHAKWIAKSGNPLPRYDQIQTLLALLVVGVIVGQIIRQVKSMASEYRERTASAGNAVRG